MLLPLSALAAIMVYQATNPAIYYLIGVGVYFWAYSEGEVCDSFYLLVLVSIALVGEIQRIAG